MESMNYTYEKNKCKKVAAGTSVITNGLGYPPISNGNCAIIYEAWVINDNKGRKIAEATSEKQAVIIVSALNGVAV